MKRHEFLISSYGGAQPNISQKTIKESLIPIPSLEIQKKVVSFLDAISSGSIRLNDIEREEPLTDIPRKVAEITNIMVWIEEARRLRARAIGDAEEILSSATSQIFKEQAVVFGQKPLEALISMTSGENLTSNQMDDAMPYSVYGGGGLMGKHDQFLVEDSKIVIGRVGARCGCVFVTEPKSWITDNALYLTHISEHLDRDYLVYALRNLDLRQQAKEAAQPVVSQKRIKSQLIPLPPLPVQRRIVTFLDSLQATVDELKTLQDETEKEVEELIPSILDKAFAGEL